MVSLLNVRKNNRIFATIYLAMIDKQYAIKGRPIKNNRLIFESC